MERYKKNEVNLFKFLQIPKELFINKCYRCKLNSDSKLTYGLLLDRMHLSEKNNWCNENGEIYLLYTKENVADMLGVSPRTVYKSFKALEECELISQERQGLNKPNKIYICKFKSDFSRMCKLCSSKHAEFTSQEMYNVQSNNTNLNNTEINNTIIKGILTEVENSYDYLQVINYYLDSYESCFKQQHPILKKKHWITVIDSLITVDLGITVEDVDEESEMKMMDNHFVTLYENCDYNILHYISGDIRKIRYFEECY